MALGRITPPGGSRVGHPCYTGLHEWHFFLSLVLFKPFFDLAYKNTKGTSSCSHTCVCVCVCVCVFFFCDVNLWRVYGIYKRLKYKMFNLSIKQRLLHLFANEAVDIKCSKAVSCAHNTFDFKRNTASVKMGFKKSRMTCAVPTMFPNNA
jgi:Na+/melibiose symporter-like transporter